MRLSSLADYAIVMMTAAARNCGATKLNATLLAEQTGVPLPTAQKLVSRIAAAGLLESARGIGGGFRLARPPSAISLADVVEAVEGPIALTICVDEHRHDCALDGHCAVKPHWAIVNEAVRGALAAVTLAQLAGPAASDDGSREAAKARRASVPLASRDAQPLSSLRAFAPSREQSSSESRFAAGHI